MAKDKSFKDKAISVLEKAEAIKKRGKRRPVFYTGTGKDALASGRAQSASYAGYNIDQIGWDLIFMDDAEFKKAHKMTKKQAQETE